MSKRIAVLVRDRQKEAMRMALGITLMDDKIDVYVLDRKLDADSVSSADMEMMREMDLGLYTNCRENDQMSYLTTEEIGRKLPDYDLVVPY